MSVANVKQSFFERLVPSGLAWYHKQMYFDHLARYKFAAKYVENKKVLDVACGSGYGCSMLAAAGASVVGIDISKEAISYAKSSYPHKKIKYLVADAADMPLKSNSIDVVVSFETLEHVKDYKKFLKEIKRVLKKDGKVIISTPNKLLGTESANPFHIKEFSLNEFRKLLSKNYKYVKIYGQKPVHAGYLKIVSKIINIFPPGRLRWFVDTGFKIIFRGSKVVPLKKFRRGLTPSYFLGLSSNRVL